MAARALICLESGLARVLTNKDPNFVNGRAPAIVNTIYTVNSYYLVVNKPLFGSNKVNDSMQKDRVDFVHGW